MQADPQTDIQNFTLHMQQLNFGNRCNIMSPCLQSLLKDAVMLYIITILSALLKDIVQYRIFLLLVLMVHKEKLQDTVLNSKRKG